MKGLVWVLDPVDGTTNLVHDYQNSTISLALLSDGEAIVGIVYNPYFNIFMHVFKDCQDIRRCGCASLDMVHVACGRIDGYMENHLKLWDYAAGTLIVREAGGEVLNYDGENLSMLLDGSIVAGNPYIARDLVQRYLIK